MEERLARLKILLGERADGYSDDYLTLLLQEAEASGVPEYPDYVRGDKWGLAVGFVMLVFGVVLILLSGPLAGFWERLWRFSLILLGGVVVAALLAWAVGAFRPQKF